MKTCFLLLSVAALTGSQLLASVSVELTAPASTVEVGGTLTFTATARDSTNPNAQFTYQFTYRTSGVGPYTVLQDFYTTNTFSWTPSDHEGAFDVGVTAQSSTGAHGDTITPVQVISRITSAYPVISPTKNTLVALYSAPPCNAPGSVRVRFGAGGLNNYSQLTPMKPCAGTSINFYIAGMRPNTTYVMQQDHFFGSQVVSGPLMTWRTGNVPSSVALVSHVKLDGPQAPTAVTYPFLFRTLAVPFATDLNENLVWYSSFYEPNDSGTITRLTNAGTILYYQDDPVNSAKTCPHGHAGGCGDHQFLREADLAGNVIRETNWTILNQFLNNLRRAQGKSLVHLDQISHEINRLPNGDTVVLVTDEEIKDQGSGPALVLGDVVVVLNQNLVPVWAWNSFDYMDPKRLPTVTPPTCVDAQGGCPGKLYTINPTTHQPFTQASDWTHANSVSYDPRDGNFVVSFRNQSWIKKIAYENGSGDGHVLWTLGFGGSFQLASGYPVSDWFSGQHNPEFQANGLLSLFDNNNPSPATEQPGGDSHGQAWQLDTTRMIATPVVNIDLGAYSAALGAAKLLSNGNYEFNSGFIDAAFAQVSEYTPSGTLVYRDQTDGQMYRSFRIRDFYTP